MEHLERKFTLKYTFSVRYLRNFMEKIACIYSHVFFIKGDRKVNAKSIIGLISLDLHEDDEITIYVSGVDKSNLERDMELVIGILGG